MSFVRPQARAALWRAREVLSGMGIALLGLYWQIGPGGLLGLMSWILMVTGAALVVVGLRRMRFRQAGLGPGVVQVDEGQITYFGPLAGGAAAASEISRLIYDPTHHPAHWVIEQPGSRPLHIPVNADGAEALFDAFGALPGLRTSRLLQVLNGRAPMPEVVWERTPAAPATRRLH